MTAGRAARDVGGRHAGPGAWVRWFFFFFFFFFFPTDPGGRVGPEPQRIGAAEARWAHNPKVPGSKPGFATQNFLKFFKVVKKFCARAKKFLP